VREVSPLLFLSLSSLLLSFSLFHRTSLLLSTIYYAAASLGTLYQAEERRLAAEMLAKTPGEKARVAALAVVAVIPCNL
jgi:hypothetical protein